MVVSSWTRISFDPAIMGGQACIRGLRIPVATVVKLAASGMTTTRILEDYPDLQADDIAEALRYAAALTEERLLGG